MTADHEVSAKTSAEELKTWADATQVIGSKAHSLFPVSSFTGVHTTVDLKEFDVVKMMRRLAQKEHSAALPQLVSRVDKACEKKVDPETPVATHSHKLKADISNSSEVAELKVDLGARSAQQLKMDAMRFDERKILATTTEDLEQGHCRRPCGDATTGALDSESTENSGRPTGSVH